MLLLPAAARGGSSAGSPPTHPPQELDRPIRPWANSAAAWASMPTTRDRMCVHCPCCLDMRGAMHANLMDLTRSRTSEPAAAHQAGRRSPFVFSLRPLLRPSFFPPPLAVAGSASLPRMYTSQLPPLCSTTHKQCCVVRTQRVPADYCCGTLCLAASGCLRPPGPAGGLIENAVGSSTVAVRARGTYIGARKSEHAHGKLTRATSRTKKKKTGR